MKLSLLAVAVSALLPVVTLAAAQEAPSSAGVAVVDGKFGDHVEGGRVVGDGASVLASKKAVYWIDVANTGAATQVTLVWNIDGTEVQRQSLDVGTSPHWHTWGIRPLGAGKRVDVTVLDASGRTLRTDSVGTSS